MVAPMVGMKAGPKAFHLVGQMVARLVELTVSPMAVWKADLLDDHLAAEMADRLAVMTAEQWAKTMAGQMASN